MCNCTVVLLFAGICVADPIGVSVSLPLSVSVPLPYQVVRGEQLELTGSVYNQQPDNIMVKNYKSHDALAAALWVLTLTQ